MVRAGALDDPVELGGVEPDLVVGVAAADADAAHHDGAHRAAAGGAGDRSGARAARGHHVADDFVGDVGGDQAEAALDFTGGELDARASRAAPDVAALATEELDAAARANRRAIAIGHARGGYRTGVAGDSPTSAGAGVGERGRVAVVNKQRGRTAAP